MSVTKEDEEEEEAVQEQDEEDDEDDEEEEEEEEDKDEGSTHAIVVADLNVTMKPQGEREALENSKGETRRTRGDEGEREGDQYEKKKKKKRRELNISLPQSNINQRSNGL